MPLDQVENFVEANVAGTHTGTENTISLQSGEASNLPDPSNGEYNLVWFDSTNFSRPSEDSEVEIVRVTGRDTTNDTITVLRGQENTTAVAHDTANSDYVLILAQTAKMIEDVDAADFSTNSLTVAGNSVALGSSTAVEYIDLNDTGSSFPIPNTDLSNSSVSIAGNSVALGGSTPIDHSDLSNINSGDHHIRYTDEESQDAFGSMLTGQQSLINVTYDDANNEVDFVVQEANIDHDSLTGFVSNEHINHSNVSISAGTHLTGGGDLTASRTLNVDETGIDATNLDGSAGTSGQLLQTDGSTLSFADVTGGMTKAERQAFNDLVAQMARNDFADNLNEMAYDGGLFDIWRDTSKIASSSNVVVSTLDGGDSIGKVELKSLLDKDGFEDGDITSNPSWDGIGAAGLRQVQSSVVKNGSNSLELAGGGNGAFGISHDGGTSSISDGDVYEAWLYNTDSGNQIEYSISNDNTERLSNDAIRMRLSNAGDFRFLTADGTGSVIENKEGITYQENTWYRLRMTIRPSQSEVDFEVFDTSGTIVESFFNISTSGASSITYIELWNSDVTTSSAYYDDVTIGQSGGIGSSGSVTSVSKDLSLEENGGFTSAPSSVVISQRATLPTDTDLQYVVRDGNGNTVTVTQSEVDTEVDTSALTSTTVEIELQLSQSTTDDDATPTSDDFMAHFKE